MMRSSQRADVALINRLSIGYFYGNSVRQSTPILSECAASQSLVLPFLFFAPPLRFMASSTFGRNLTPTKVAGLLMTKNLETNNDVSSRPSGRSRRNVLHYVLGCPRETHCKSCGEITIEKCTRFTNAYGFLKSCVENRDKEALLKLYHESVQHLHRNFAAMLHKE